jgi:protein-L-isoaspartate(D-aspartate) O-methyltransferase
MLLDRDEARRRDELVKVVESRIGPIAARFREALLAVNRADFVRPSDRSRAWVDEPLPLETPHGHAVATVSAPHAYVLGFDALDLGRGDHLLELGSGSGYGAALAAHVVGPTGKVTSVEVDPHLARLATLNTARIPNVHTLHADGLSRPDLVASHRKCWLTFSVDVLPTLLLDAIAEGGVLVAPVGLEGWDQRLLRYRRRSGILELDDLGAVRFVRARSLIEY